MGCMEYSRIFWNLWQKFHVRIFYATHSPGLLLGVRTKDCVFGIWEFSHSSTSEGHIMNNALVESSGESFIARVIQNRGSRIFISPDKLPIFFELLKLLELFLVFRYKLHRIKIKNFKLT